MMPPTRQPPIPPQPPTKATPAPDDSDIFIPDPTRADAGKVAGPRKERGPDEKETINWLAEFRGLALMLLAVLAFHTFIAKPFYIPSASMVPTLLVGDRLIVSKYPYGWSWVSVSFHLLPRSSWRIAPSTPEYGDVVIAVPPDRAEDYIKRVIGLPGDTIALVDGQVILNGQPVPQDVEPAIQLPAERQNLCNGSPCLAAFEPYRVRLQDGTEVYEPPTYRETLPNGASYTIIDHMDQPLDNTEPVTVPEGHVFLMGDNRDHSADSRAPAGPYGNGLGGPVPIADIGGRAEIITFSLDGTATYNPLTWIGALRGHRAWTSLRPELRPRPGSRAAARSPQVPAAGPSN